jgi:hypothetical protein
MLDRGLSETRLNLHSKSQLSIQEILRLATVARIVLYKKLATGATYVAFVIVA